MSAAHVINEYPENHCQMTALAMSFPTLEHAPGVYPWDPRKLNNWARTCASHGGRLAAQFCLRVWNSTTRWSCGRFDLIEAMCTFDDAHRRALIAWVSKPWWP